MAALVRAATAVHGVRGLAMAQSKSVSGCLSRLRVLTGSSLFLSRPSPSCSGVSPVWSLAASKSDPARAVRPLAALHCIRTRPVWLWIQLCEGRAKGCKSWLAGWLASIFWVGA